MATLETPWGPNGKAVYERTYSRPKNDGTFETWPETVDRVVTGNLSLVYGPVADWPDSACIEYDRLCHYMERFAIIPAGRQLWASGVEGRQFLFNCHVSGWGKKFSEHFAFTFMRLVEGGGVGANYSTRLFEHYGAPARPLEVYVTCDESHKDYELVKPYATDYASVPAKHIIVHVEDTREGWAKALSTLIDFSMMPTMVPEHRNIVFDVSGIRPQGSPLVSSGGVASGPMPLARMLKEVGATLIKAWSVGYFSPIDMMEMDHAISVGAIAGGKRRSARMSMCHWKDDFIMDFINSKQDGSKYWTTNISVEIDEEFLASLRAGDEWASTVHNAVCEAVLKNGEPGYWNSSLSNVGELGTVIATNPCGEIPLEAWEACNLGSINLDAFVDLDFALGFDYHALEEAHRLMTRFLIRSTYGDISDPKQRAIQDNNRRIGLSHMGVQGFFAKAYGLRYSEIAQDPGSGIMKPSSLLNRLYSAVRDEAHKYTFELRIPEPVKVTCEKPDGTTSKMPGTQEGIHPIYARWFEQRIRFSLRDELEWQQVEDFRAQGFKVETDVYDESGMTAVVVFPTENILVSQMRDLGLDVSLVESAEQLTVEDMLSMQAFYQDHWADNAVSYTVNIPEGTVTPDELATLLVKYLPRLKGTTIMVDASRKQAPYTRISQHEYTVAEATRQSDALNEACATGACPVK